MASATKLVDSRGKTKDEAVKACREIAARHPGHKLVLGRLYYSARRWSWGERFGDEVAHDLEHGGRWEPVEVVAPA